MKKKILSVLLCAAMMTGLAVCAGTSSTPAAPAQEPAAAEETAEEAAPAEETAEEAPAAEDAPAEEVSNGDVKHVVMSMMTWTGAPADTQAVQDAMNDILIPKVGAEVELQILDAGAYNQNMTLALAGGEQIDLLLTITLGYPTLVAKGNLLDMEEDDLLSTYGAGILDVVDAEYIEACRIDGGLYGLPNNRDFAQGRGCMAVRKDMLEGIGYEIPEAEEEVPITIEELTDLLYKMHEAYPEMETYRPVAANSLAQTLSYDALGGNTYGVLMNYGQDLTVENLFESQEYMDYCKRMYQWNKDGLISQNAATDPTDVESLTTAGQLIAFTTAGKPGITAQESPAGKGRDMVIFQFGEDFMASSSISSWTWSIPYTTADAATAMKVLNEFYTNPELANMLCYGVEGVNYEINEEGLLDTSLGTNAGAFQTLNFCAPNEFITVPLVGNTVDLWDQVQKFNAESNKSKALGFTFDSAPVSTEITAVANAYAEYQKSVEFGYVDPEVGIPEMNEKLKAAGLETIIAEKQRQLDEWLAAKGE